MERERERRQGLLSVGIHNVHLLLVTVSDCIQKKKKPYDATTQTVKPSKVSVFKDLYRKKKE